MTDKKDRREPLGAFAVSKYPYGYFITRMYGKRDLGKCTVCDKSKPIWNNENGNVCKECSQ